MNPKDCSMVCPFSLVSDKKYSVNTYLGDFKGIIKGTFNRYERNKIMFKDIYVWSIVLLDWECEGDPHPDGKPCKIPLYLDLNDKLAFYEIQ
jgi:hypothetical protein